jgi:cytidylate kinase
VASSEEEIRRSLEERDRRDSGRKVAPLVRAPGSVEIDTTGLTVDQQVDRIVRLVREAGG